jgi:2-C-methyl-D-erythritol 4-phosphate cytidylyltransferase
MRVNAVIVAAGKGERLGTRVPKPFLRVCDVPLLVHTLRSLDRARLLSTLVVVIAPEHEELCRELLQAHGPFRCDIRLAHGGPQRQDSVRLGLAALDDGCDIVVIHDAARPFVSPTVIHNSIRVASQAGAALVAVPAADTLKRVEKVDDDNHLIKKRASFTFPAQTVVETLPRQDVWLAQTPQTFHVELIRNAHQRALDEAIRVTDDAALIEKIGGTVQIVPGERRNFKITTPDDLRLAEALLRFDQAQTLLSQSGR